jgi:peptidoglycan/xylan/chitin deacetylase (PgdA/CDA1 family)/uncharacterized caspase-like protein
MAVKRLYLAAAVLLAIAGGVFWLATHKRFSATTPAAPAASSGVIGKAVDDSDLRTILDSYRRIIVLLAEENTLSDGEKESAKIVGQALFHDKLAREDTVIGLLSPQSDSADPNRFAPLERALDFIESDPSLYDADRLAFREVLRGLQRNISGDGRLPAIKLHKRLGEDLDAIAEIEHNYEKEVAQIFSRFDARAIVQKREKWEDYVAHLKKLYTRDQVLRDFGVIVPYSADKLPKDDSQREIFGDALPPRTVVLSFDDGPHPQYTEEIVAILKQYNVPAVFFEVGRNIGTLDAEGHAKLGRNAAVSRSLLAAGYAVGNHSYTHAQLSKESGSALKAEITNTDTLLQSVDPKRSALFRFPYGARNGEGMKLLAGAHLRSVMWNIDSLDWADPVPRSIADRVLRGVDKEGHGIILFHDIHERTIKALPLVLDRLVADGYRFAAWDGDDFTPPAAEAQKANQTITTGYADSWAVVIGINDYAKWPKLQYAVHDADAIRQTLIERFGFAPEHVLSLKDGEATRNGILGLFHDTLAHGALKKNDRVFVFFAGHGGTVSLNSGRDIGYLIPVDADPKEIATDAIPMTEIQNIAEGLAAKHVFFVMDACYSGLGLTRGSGSRFLNENAKRIGRQMLTAGGADQMVADGGPNGHSVFTWTLLQGLNGKADLNGDGLITATELAAYVAPAVASVAPQTPAFGSLPGSEGGDFVFALPAEAEFLSANTTQLANDAIALNGKLDASRPTTTPPEPGKIAPLPPVIVKDLQGKEQKLLTPPPVSLSARQLAQRANDRGLQLFKEKRYDEAQALFTEALKLRPDFALAANNLGFVYYKLQRYAEATRWLENSVKSDPSRAVAYVNLGDAYDHLGSKDQAAKAYRTYLELAPTGAASDYVKQRMREM